MPLPCVPEDANHGCTLPCATVGRALPIVHGIHQLLLKAEGLPWAQQVFCLVQPQKASVQAPVSIFPLMQVPAPLSDLCVWHSPGSSGLCGSLAPTVGSALSDPQAQHSCFTSGNRVAYLFSVSGKSFFFLPSLCSQVLSCLQNLVA